MDGIPKKLAAGLSVDSPKVLISESMHTLPTESSTGALNMAQDLLLLEAYPHPEIPRFRSYGWSEPAFTFGVSQKWSDFRPQVPGECTLIRRATGGGLVSHLEDWTFALVIPSAHHVFQLDALESYGMVLRALEQSLRAQGQTVAMVPSPSGPRTFQAPDVCATRSEPHDLVRTSDGKKVAGAAQKRTREGLLLQGYLWKPFLTNFESLQLQRDFATGLAEALGTKVEAVKSPAYPKDITAAAAEKFSSKVWNERL
jgi:lipoate-protein ligase A